MWLLNLFLITACCYTDLAFSYGPNSDKQNGLYERTYFYVGGGYASDGNGGHIYKDQMYVEKLDPVRKSNSMGSIVFIHGQGQTGTV